LKHLSVRPGLEDIEPYVSPQRPARYRMNTNESPYAPPQQLVDEVTRELAASEFNRYPDKDAKDLQTALCAHTGWPEEGLWIANGSNEVFLQLFLAYGGSNRKAITFEPTYSLHSLIARITDTGSVTASRPEGWTLDVPSVEVALDREDVDIALLCSPNNPTGAAEPLKVIEHLLQRVPLVVVDEAYIEFARPEASARSLLDEHQNLVITRTFSKAWRLAGARLGYLLAHASVVEGLHKVRLPYHLSSPSQLLGLAALRSSDATLEAVEAIKRERQAITEGLRGMGITAYASDANFVLFEVDAAGGEAGEATTVLWESLLSRGVLVRSYAKDPLLSNCLRVTAGTPEETSAFLEAIEEVVGAQATV